MLHVHKFGEQAEWGVCAISHIQLLLSWAHLVWIYMFKASPLWSPNQ